MAIIRGFTTTSDGVRIAWDRRGKGPPLLLVHGLTDYRALMEPLATRFALWHDVVNIDVRGHGESGHNGDFSLPRLCADLREVCRDLNLESPVLVGHSLGGLLVTGTDAGARAIVNIDQNLDRNATARRVTRVASELRDPSTFHATLDALFSGEVTPGLNAEIQAALDRCAWEIAPEVVLGIWTDLLDGHSEAVAAEMDALLGRVSAPYLLLLGADPSDEYRTWLRARVRPLTVEVFKGGAHFLHLAEPDRVVACVRNFLAGTGEDGIQ